VRRNIADSGPAPTTVAPKTVAKGDGKSCTGACPGPKTDAFNRQNPTTGISQITRRKRHANIDANDPSETLLGGSSLTTMVGGVKEREHAHQTVEAFRPVGVSCLGDRGRSAGVLERNLDRSLETLLPFHG
jgi:hypothetical protein